MPRAPTIAHGFLARPRFLIAIAAGAASYALVPTGSNFPNITRAIGAWNVGTVLYLILVAHMMFGATHERMRNRALRQNNGRFLVLCLVVLAALFALGGIVAELSLAKSLHGELKLAHMGLVALTVFTTWSFTQVMFALHYAHEYYMASHDDGIAGGLEFPGGHAPDYGDFLYVACVIGTSGQTADVSFSSRNLRRIGLVHCVLAFFFNTTLLALTINLASGLL